MATPVAIGYPDDATATAAAKDAQKLSSRELEVLRYLPTTLTANEIAAELYVSVNTIKTHTRSIYLKLGASRRQEAVARAYSSGILRRRSFVRSSTDVEVN
jgi:LuxR family maltose regulon positive regulatory protein